ncbi:SAM (Sterile alpha motif) domain-containing protein [Roseiarcus fermentans]|uniref:SAM (Sterile alpha motif) domain-containing protein n=1 Tax=Roseiarcus fermentans TaxID=1473586 RepID=A0A366FHE9_9HYPH|nr:adenylate/guanylate cyclase domain-containing protein [Roseiarcus fermentans]RBP14088.1 SAM (Sterile alpha motif) domain-containing protein [Roseiarcus fermentans]
MIGWRKVGTIVDVGAWLKNLGLGQYEVGFRDNAIDGDVLPSLTAEDLKEVGVAAVGHRRKLLDAIAALRTEPKTASDTTLPPEPPPAGSLHSPPSPPQKSADIAAERRPVTVMFCDLVGSTALAAKLDAEDWRDLVGAYLDAASEAVVHFGGHVLKKLGDGLMALFGYPSAQENDAERAALAALAILAALDALNARNEIRGLPRLSARIGLDMGPVVVDATGEVFGEAPNVAARTQAAAAPGTALVTAAVQRHIAGRFVAEDKGPHDLKGVSGRPILYRLVRASSGARRGGARSLTPFVGREEDLALLLRRWERARGGEGQFVQVVGEPGLGKSRLVEEFRARLGETPCTWVEWATSQLLQNTPLHPLAEWGRLRFGGADVPADKRLADLEEALGRAKLDAGETAALVAPLLDIPVPEARAPRRAPEEVRRRQLAALAAWIVSGARAQPLVLAFEDLHWADPTTLDLMKTLVDRGAAAPLFIVATARPEFRAPWATRSHHGVVSLVPLDRAEIRKMVGTIAERHALSNEVMDGVTDRTGGVPLFVEEVTRLLLEGGARGGAQAIPPTLQQSLAARLDRLGEAREVAQIGAVLGRDFSYGMLRSVAAINPVAAVADRGGGVADPALQRGGALTEAALQSALDKLAEADLLFVEGHAPDAAYRFKHALIQDAAYESLLKIRRQALHRRAAEALLAALEPQPELVAHHFTQAGDTESAVEWWGKAGDAALRRSAFQEAIAHLGKAIEMADKARDRASPQVDRDSREARAKVHAGYALASMMTKGFGAEETKAALARAEVHAGAIRTPRDWTVLYGRISADMMRGDGRAARAGAERFRKEAEALGLAGHALYARRTIAFLKLMAADFAGAAADLRTVIAESGAQLDQELLAIFGTDLLCFAQATLGHTIWYLGEFDESRRLFKAALDGATTWGQVSSQCAALFNDALVGARGGRAAAVLPVAETLLTLAETNELKFWRAAGAKLAGWARVRLGQHDAAAAFRARLETDAELGAKLNQPTSKALLADVERTLGRHDEALAAVARGLAIADETGEDWVRCWLLRLRGEVLVEADAAGAEAAYRDALLLSVAQGARSETLLVSIALARLYQSTSRPVEAYAVLSDALEGFAPTSEMPAIAEAQALIEDWA